MYLTKCILLSLLFQIDLKSNKIKYKIQVVVKRNHALIYGNKLNCINQRLSILRQKKIMKFNYQR